MIDMISVSYVMGFEPVSSPDETVDEDAVYYKYEYVPMSVSNFVSPSRRKWYEGEEGAYIPTNDVVPVDGKTYYARTLTLADPEGDENPSELGWVTLSEGETFYSPESTIALAPPPSATEIDAR